ncbi:hypothetical protein CCHR01_08040 [Colletotrichum chrysophilum]|uniref:Uncharacterized protein n=1 Tax=Colletotrichum chrysophilum TaxID=1836956 RepID=A0AAD9EI96_9PEZI|nr:hypothetical protein CCHR01_08040 [Colletotrichum chrysophilum]
MKEDAIKYLVQNPSQHYLPVNMNASLSAKSRKRIKSLRKKCWEYSNLPHKHIALIIHDDNKDEWNIYNSEKGNDRLPFLEDIMKQKPKTKITGKGDFLPTQEPVLKRKEEEDELAILLNSLKIPKAPVIFE